VIKKLYVEKKVKKELQNNAVSPETKPKQVSAHTLKKVEHLVQRRQELPKPSTTN
jgi:hypothetical protein